MYQEEALIKTYQRKKVYLSFFLIEEPPMRNESRKIRFSLWVNLYVLSVSEFQSLDPERSVTAL